MAELGRAGGLAIIRPTLSRRTAVQALIVAAAGVALWTFLHFFSEPHDYFDLRVYYGSINYWINGDGQLYDFLQPHTEYGFTYPPFAALVMSPMAFMSWPVAATVTTALSIGTMLLVLYWLIDPLSRRYGWSRWFVLLISLEVAAALEPVRETISFGQVNLALLLLVAADMLVLLRKDHRLAGVGIGLATAIKLTPGIFIVYLLVARKWRAAGVSIATTAAATWLAATIDPDASRVFWTDAVWNTRRIGSTSFVSNQSLNGIVSRLNPSDPSRSLWLALVIVALAVWVWRVRRAAAVRDEAAALGLTGLISCLVSPISWIHHLVWAMPAIVLLFVHVLEPGRSRVSRRGWLLLTLFSYALLSSRAVWPFKHTFLEGWGPLGSNLYVLLMCLLLVVLPVRAPAPGGSAVRRSGDPGMADIPDLVELDRKVTAAFGAKRLGRPANDEAGAPVGAGRPLVGAQPRP